MEKGPHPQHGVNPTKVQCFVCRSPTHEVYLYGNDIQGKAPDSTPVDFRLCDRCNETAKTHVYCIETKYQEDNEDSPEWFGDGVWVPRDEAKRIFVDLHLEFNEYLVMLELPVWEKFKTINSDKYDNDESNLRNNKLFTR